MEDSIRDMRNLELNPLANLIHKFMNHSLLSHSTLDLLSIGYQTTQDKHNLSNYHPSKINTHEKRIKLDSNPRIHKHNLSNHSR